MIKCDRAKRSHGLKSFFGGCAKNPKMLFGSSLKSTFRRDCLSIRLLNSASTAGQSVHDTHGPVVNSVCVFEARKHVAVSAEVVFTDTSWD